MQVLAQLLELRAGVDRKWTWESPEPAGRVMSVMRAIRSVSSRWPGSIGHGLAERLVLEAARHVDEHVAARQPALAGAVDVGVGDLPEPDVAADVEVPGAEVRVDVVVVAVRLVRHAGGERKCTRHGTGRPVASSSTVTCTQLRPGSTSSTRTRWSSAEPSRSTSPHRTRPSSSSCSRTVSVAEGVAATVA